MGIREDKKMSKTFPKCKARQSYYVKIDAV